MALRGDRVLLVVGLAGGILFFLSLPVLWPLAPIDLETPHAELREKAREFLEGRGFALDGYRSAAMLVVSDAALDFVEHTLGRERAEQWIAAGLPLADYRVEFKKRNDPVTYSVNVHPAAGVLGFSRTVPADYPGASLDEDEARRLALEALGSGLHLDPGAFAEQSATSSDEIRRRTHEFVLEREIPASGGLCERVTLTVDGDEVSRAVRWLRVPDEAGRRALEAQAPAVVLETTGFTLLAAGAVIAFFVFLRALGRGAIRLGPVAVWPAAVFVCTLGTMALEAPRLFRNWEPLWPEWVSNLRYLAFAAIEQSFLLVVLLAVIAAGQASDDALGGRRGASLWSLARGRILDPAVARASGRGFLVGLVCGGVMAASVLALQTLAGATTGIQPRGFFFYTINSSAPAVASLLFFFGIALAEELGYRFFAGSWLLGLTKRPWLAVALPALVYGLVHTRLDFLPPAEPFWARPLVLTLVGAVWGWAFLRYDALTVVLSHFTADLFIFNWPRLASGRPALLAISVLTIAVPLVPFFLGAVHGSGRRTW